MSPIRSLNCLVFLLSKFGVSRMPGARMRRYEDSFNNSEKNGRLASVSLKL